MEKVRIFCIAKDSHIFRQNITEYNVVTIHSQHEEKKIIASARKMHISQRNREKKKNFFRRFAEIFHGVSPQKQPSGPRYWVKLIFIFSLR